MPRGTASYKEKRKEIVSCCLRGSVLRGGGRGENGDPQELTLRPPRPGGWAAVSDSSSPPTSEVEAVSILAT